MSSFKNKSEAMRQERIKTAKARATLIQIASLGREHVSDHVKSLVASALKSMDEGD